MLQKGKTLANRLRDAGPDGLRVIPEPRIDLIEQKGAASIDLRLGRWFSSLRQTRLASLRVEKSGGVSFPADSYTRRHFIPFGQEFVLHPGTFVLGITLEWIRLPPGLGGYVLGKSSWGRRGLIIETAAGVHPGFSGCLTLELSNVGEVAIEIIPGIMICQLFLHATTAGPETYKSSFDGRRRPVLGSIEPDEVVEKLSRPI
jgi:dCTP deaminase